MSARGRKFTRPRSVADGLVRRHCRLLDRVEACESVHGPDSAVAEKAVRMLIAFEEDAGSALAEALAECPPPHVRVRVNGSEPVFRQDDG